LFSEFLPDRIILTSCFFGIFQGCIAVYLSRYLLSLSDSLLRLPQAFYIVNNFFKIFSNNFCTYFYTILAFKISNNIPSTLYSYKKVKIRLSAIIIRICSFNGPNAIYIKA